MDLGELIEESAAATAQLMAEREIDLQLQLPEAAPRVTADRDRVKQVLLNLLSNAAKFCDASDGRVIVELGVDDGAARVDVRDNGPGVQPEERQVIFERFRQSGVPTGTSVGHRTRAADQPRDNPPPRRRRVGGEHRRPGRHLLVHPSARTDLPARDAGGHAS